MICKCGMSSVLLPAVLVIGAGAAIGGLMPASQGPTASAIIEAAAPTVFTVDAVHSSVIFRCKHLNTSFAYGRFNDISGTFALPADGEGAMIDVTVKTESVDTANGGRDGHLKSPDFFDAKQFPTITFKSSSVTKKSEGKYSATGTLTFHGVSKEITVDVDKTGEGPGMRGGTIAGLETTFSISRKEFGMNYMPEGLGDEVRIVVALEGGAK